MVEVTFVSLALPGKHKALLLMRGSGVLESRLSPEKILSECVSQRRVCFIDDGNVVRASRRGYGEVPEPTLLGLIKEEGLLVYRVSRRSEFMNL